MGSFMKSKSDNDILNQWWANGVPLSGAGGATGTAVDLPVTAKVTTIGGATPTLTGGAQHFVLTGASPVDATYIGDIKFGEELPAGTQHIGSATVFLAAGDANFGNVDIVTLPALEQTTPALSAVTIAVPDTEYTQGLPANCRAVQFQCRTANDVRYAWATGKVATPVDPYFTLKGGQTYWKENLKLTAATLHVAAAASVLYVEVEAWT